MPVPQTPLMNPTGVTGAGSFNTGGMFMPPTMMPGMGSAPGMPQPKPIGVGGPGNYGFGNVNPNPATGGGVGQGQAGGFPPVRAMSTPTPGAGGPSAGGQSPTDPATGKVTGQGGSTTSSANPWGQSQSQQNWTEKYLQKTFGGGMGSMIYQYLMSNGGFNSSLTQQTIDAQTNAAERQIQMGANDIASQMGAMGITGGSSSLPLAESNFETGAINNLNQITAQEYYNMWNQSQQNELNMMQFAATGTGKTLANTQHGFWDYASMGLGLATDVAQYAATVGV